MLTAGIHNIPADQYHADPAPEPSLSSSIAKILVDQSPLHAWHQHPRLNPNFEPEESSRFDLGSAAHMLLLEKRYDAIVIVNADDWRTKAAKELRDEARTDGRTPVLARHYEVMNLMVVGAKTFIATTELAGIFETGLAEQSVLWQDVGGVWCRCRPDLLAADRRIVLDYKTTENAEPEAFIRQIGRMSYDLQAEFYVRGIKAATGEEPVFIFLAQEITAPYACSLVALANTYRAVGQSKVNRALELWDGCTTFNQWPAYSKRIHYAEPKPYELADLETPEPAAEDDE